MKIAFPCQEDHGLESLVHGHFGSANHFLIVEVGTERCEVVDNANREHGHGQCQPLAALGGRTVDAVVVGGIGRGALLKLRDAGIAVYRAVEGTIQQNLALVQWGRLPKLDPDQTCTGHQSAGGCSH